MIELSTRVTDLCERQTAFTVDLQSLGLDVTDLVADMEGAWIDEPSRGEILKLLSQMQTTLLQLSPNCDTEKAED